MRKVCVVLTLLLLAALPSAAKEVTMHGAWVPPVKALEANRNLPPAAVADILSVAPASPLVFDTFEGQNPALAALLSSASSKGVKAGTGFALNLTGKDLFTAKTVVNGWTVYTGAVTSVDAYAIRLKMVLSGLAPDDEVYAVAPGTSRAFGPYTVANATKWLPLIEGDTCVVVLRTHSVNLPGLLVEGFSHFYLPFDEAAGKATGKQSLPCNINIACESNATIQQLSTAVGIMVIPEGGYDSALCSGTLLNNGQTAEFEPYLMTANHCIGNNSEALDVDIVWDYRATACGANNPPALSSLPRSNGDAMLATNSVIDMTLMRLDTVPSGTLGRHYAGYTTRSIAVSEPVIGIHHPQGVHMRISYGAIRGTDTGRLGWAHQYHILWTEGVTEPGSSGSGLFAADGEYLYIGALSNGEEHSCFDTSNNYDYYGALANFFPFVENWLYGTGGDPVDACPAEVVLKASPGALDTLRDLRDSKLMKSAWGRKLVKAYYKNAPALAQAAKQSEAFRQTFYAIAGPVAGLVE